MRLIETTSVKPGDSVNLLRATDTYLELTLVNTITGGKWTTILVNIDNHTRTFVRDYNNSDSVTQCPG